MDEGEVLFNGIWNIWENDRGTWVQKGTNILSEIDLGEYEWIEITAVEGYQKNTFYSLNPSYVADYNAMWVITRYEKKVTSS
jgi:hypothetical protein